MYTYDEIIANGYFVFKEKLSTSIIMTFIAIRKKKYGERFSRDSLKLKKLKGIVEFKNPYYTLVDGKSLTSLTPYLKPELIVLFQVIDESIEKGYLESEKLNNQDGKRYVKKI